MSTTALEATRAIVAVAKDFSRNYPRTWLNEHEAATRLRQPVGVVRRAVMSGQLNPLKVGSSPTRWFPPEDIDRLRDELEDAADEDDQD